MSNTSITKATSWEDSDVTFLARVKVDSNNALTNVTQADVAAITYKVFCQGVQVLTTATVDISAAVFNALQTGSIWTADTTGFNFKVQVPATFFPNGDKVYRVEFHWQLAAGTAFYLVYEVTTQNVWSS